MRIIIMITKGNRFDLSSNSLNKFFKKCIQISLENLYLDIGA